MCRAFNLALFLAFAVQASGSYAALPGVAAEIVSLQGKGEFRAATEPRWRDASVGQKLAEGNFVRTGDVSRMAVLLVDQTQVRLGSNSMMQIKQVGDGRGRDTILNQSAGRSWTQSKNIPNRLTVETPSAFAAIRGTDWELVVDEDGSSTLTVLSGEVLLSNDQGSVTIGPGEQARAQLGQAPVKKLLRNPRERVQWVSSFTIDPQRYPEIDRSTTAIGSEQAALNAVGADLRAGNLAAARSAISRLVLRQPATGTAILLLADFQVIEGEFELAVATLREGAKQYPGDERFDVWRARLHLFRDEIPEAREALASARARNPSSTEAMIVEGELERFEGNARAATAAYSSAMVGAPGSARAWHGLGVVQTSREDVSNARDSLNRALALDPKGMGFRGELGTLEAFADNLGAARVAFLRALEEHADDYAGLTGLAIVELKAGNTEEAVTRLLAATLIEPRYARAQTYLAVAYYQLRRTRDALSALSRARELDPKDPLPDIFESVIHDDLLQPGDALVTARRAMSLLPYLKSLNQVATNLKGNANLGTALATFGLENWARSYAQNSYYPFWAGSHLFLADHYSGEFNKTSALFQGFLTDPTVFGASNRFSTLIPRPGVYWSVGGRYNNGRDFQLAEPTITGNGFVSSPFPIAYFAEAIRSDVRPDQVALDGRANTYTLAFGARPTYELGLFAYGNAFDADIALSPTGGNQQRISGRNERLDLGGNYRFGPESQAWLKIGGGNESSTINQVTTVMTDIGLAARASTFQTEPDQRDLQFRHTFAVGDRHELSWGVELGRLKKTNTLVQENYFHIGSGSVPSDRLDETDDDRSRDLWLSDRFHVGERLLLQADVAWQHYTKTRTIDIYRDRVPPVTQDFPENYDRSIFAPRLGAAYVLGDGATLRGVYQKWLRPASYSSLTTIATAGIPIDDSLVYPGGTLSRYRGQLDWEISPAWFVTAYGDYRNVDNLNSPLDGVLNTRTDVANLDRLRQRSVTNLIACDRLEASPIFSRGTATSGGLTIDHVVSRNFAGYIGYANTHSENTGTSYKGKAIPYVPENCATVGVTWASDQRMIVSAQAVWRSTRFIDEPNQIPLSAGWDIAVRVQWESDDKHWNVDAYAANLLKPNVHDLVGVNVILRF